MSNTTLAGRGTERLAISSTSAQLTNTNKARRALIYVDGTDIAWENAGTTATTGDAKVPAGSTIDLTDGIYEFSNMAFISNTGATGTLHVTYW